MQFKRITMQFRCDEMKELAYELTKAIYERSKELGISGKSALWMGAVSILAYGLLMATISWCENSGNSTQPIQDILDQISERLNRGRNE